LIKHGWLQDRDPVWVEDATEEVEVVSIKGRLRREPASPGLHDTVLALLPARFKARLPENPSRRRGTVKGALDAVPDLFVSSVFLTAILFGGSLNADAGYIAAIEAVAVWGGFFLDAAYGSGRNRSQRAAFGAGFLLYYGGIVAGIGVLGAAGPWPALYALVSLLEKMPRIVRRMRPSQQRVALETVIRGFGAFAFSNLLIAASFVFASVVEAMAPGHVSAPPAAFWSVFMCAYLLGQAAGKLVGGIFEEEISAYVDYCVAYNMLGRGSMADP
jgi:hypothetical protein